MMQISSNTQEQTALTQEVTANVTEISYKIDTIKENIHHTGKSFYDISERVENIRRNMVEMAEEISDCDAIHLAIADHLNWRWQIYNQALGFTKITPEQVGDHHSCRLGRWVESRGKHIPQYATYLEKLEGSHDSLHQVAKEAVKAFNTHQQAKGYQLLSQVAQLSEEIVGSLEKMLQVKA
jgi:methyl-accepting chemotaxis protein